jgi:hypothetical protein
MGRRIPARHDFHPEPGAALPALDKNAGRKMRGNFFMSAF